mmetsp:Transcript_54133/g.137276  ORF Transcript_54133/g.137276 Transcript_54133/m.137276 type:complete len:113 (-) Transcript_54133:40-378(-)
MILVSTPLSLSTSNPIAAFDFQMIQAACKILCSEQKPVDTRAPHQKERSKECIRKLWGNHPLLSGWIIDEHFCGYEATNAITLCNCASYLNPSVCKKVCCATTTGDWQRRQA